MSEASAPANSPHFGVSKVKLHIYTISEINEASIPENPDHWGHKWIKYDSTIQHDASQH